MTRVICPLKDCGHRLKNGSCHRPTIKLQQTESETNEMFCLAWETPDTKLFREVTQYPEVIPEALKAKEEGKK